MGSARQMTDETRQYLLTLPRSKRICLKDLAQVDVAMAIDKLAELGTGVYAPRYRSELAYLVWCPDSVRLHFGAYLWHTMDVSPGYRMRMVHRIIFHEATLCAIVRILGLSQQKYVRRLKVSRRNWADYWAGQQMDAPLVYDPTGIVHRGGVKFSLSM